MKNINSFYAPMSLPWKLLQSKSSIINGQIHPVHIKLSITNHCNASCSFCSCKNIERNIQLPTEEILDLIRHFHTLGTRAITLLGGGEPSIHPGLQQVFELCKELDIHLSIVTNGLIWSKKEEVVLANEYLSWARLSIVDTESGNYHIERVNIFSKNLANVDIGVYFTVTQNASYKTAFDIAALVEKLPNCTHIKFVEDVVNGAPKQMDEIEKLTSSNTKVIIQRWEKMKTGQANCLVSKLRPLIASDGYVYPCCSVPQCKDYVLAMPTEFRMVKWHEFNIDTPIFDGSICKRCPWDEHNQTLYGLLTKLEHPRFI